MNDFEDINSNHSLFLNKDKDEHVRVEKKEITIEEQKVDTDK